MTDVIVTDHVKKHNVVIFLDKLRHQCQILRDGDLDLFQGHCSQTVETESCVSLQVLPWNQVQTLYGYVT